VQTVEVVRNHEDGTCGALATTYRTGAAMSLGSERAQETSEGEHSRTNLKRGGQTRTIQVVEGNSGAMDGALKATPSS